MLTQALAGPRSGIAAQLVRQLTLWLTTVILPGILLVLFLVQFLPYHDEVMIWWHRLAIVLDVVFLLVLWPIILHPSGAMRPVWQDLRRPWRGLHLPGSPHEHVEHVRGIRQSVIAIALVAMVLLAQFRLCCWSRPSRANGWSGAWSRLPSAGCPRRWSAARPKGGACWLSQPGCSRATSTRCRWPRAACLPATS